MNTNKIDEWFKVSVDDGIGDHWMVALFGRDNDGHDYGLTTNFVHGTTMADHPEVFRGAKGDCELMERLLNRYHSSKRSHPAMLDEMNAVADAYACHLEHHPNADFEVCDDPRCRLAVLLEQAYGWIDDEYVSHDEDRQ